MAEWWVGPLVTLLVAALGASGVWLTVVVNRRSARESQLEVERRRNDYLSRRVIVLLNYAQRLRDHIYRREGPPPEEWPEEAYDWEGK